MGLMLFKLQFIHHHFSYKTLFLKMLILATAMAFIPCFNRLLPIDRGTDNSWTIETVRHRMTLSDLDATFQALISGNWLADGDKALSVGRDSARAVMVLKKLGFSDAIGVYSSCSSLFRRRKVYALPFEEGSFDLVFLTEMLDRIRVPARVVLEMERLLRPGKVGVVIRSVAGGRFPPAAMMKAAAPVDTFLRFSSVVGVRTVNRTVVVIFRKGLIAYDEIE